MTRGETFVKNAKCTHGHRSARSNTAWCDLNKICSVLKIHDMCLSLKVIVRNKLLLLLNNFNLKVDGWKANCKIFLKEHKQLGINF